jgi:hypothetical protein
MGSSTYFEESFSNTSWSKIKSSHSLLTLSTKRKLTGNSFPVPLEASTKIKPLELLTTESEISWKLILYSNISCGSFSSLITLTIPDYLSDSVVYAILTTRLSFLSCSWRPKVFKLESLIDNFQSVVVINTHKICHHYVWFQYLDF